MSIERREHDTSFDNPNGERPFMTWPKIFGDNRGGLHAQQGKHCQSKIVEALTIPIYDIIVDARPDSKTFGLAGVYLLDPAKQNKLYVPHGFLHGFAVPKHFSDENAVFMYYCDEVYCRESEMHANPMTALPKIASMLKGSPMHAEFVNMIESRDSLVLSEKDLNSEDYETCMGRILAEYNESGKLWYRA